MCLVRCVYGLAEVASCRVEVALVRHNSAVVLACIDVRYVCLILDFVYDCCVVGGESGISGCCKELRRRYLIRCCGNTKLTVGIVTPAVYIAVLAYSHHIACADSNLSYSS